MNYNKDKFLSILNKLKESFGSQNKMAEALGISSSYITKIYDENTKNPPAPEYLKKIADNSKGITTYEELMEVCGYLDSKTKSEYYGTSLVVYQSLLDILDNYPGIELSEHDVLELADNLVNYAVFGSKDENLKKELKILLDKYKKNSNEDIKKMFIDLVNKVIFKVEEKIKESEEKSKNKYKRIPVLGSIPAGIPVELIQDIIDYEEISEEMLKGGKEYFALKVKGSSMWPKYLDGDTIIVLKQDDCESGQDAIVMVNGNDGTFKRVIKKDNGITLEPINQQEYNSVSYSNEDIEKLPIKILGVVKEIRRKI